MEYNIYTIILCHYANVIDELSLLFEFFFYNFIEIIQIFRKFKQLFLINYNKISLYRPDGHQIALLNINNKY